MPSVNVKKDRYECHKKEVCEKNNDYKPRHFSALVLCMIEEILDKLKGCKCFGKCDHPNTESKDVSNEQVSQEGIVNVNVDNILKTTKKSN